MNKDCVKRRPFNWLITRRCKIENIALHGIPDSYTRQPPIELRENAEALNQLAPSAIMDEVIFITEEILDKITAKE